MDIISFIVIIFGGLILSYTILSQRGIFPPFWNITIGAVLAAAGFVIGILLNPSSASPSNPVRRVLIKIVFAATLYLVLFAVSWLIPAPMPLPIVYCSHIPQGFSFSLTPIKSGIGVTKANDGQFIGISDGSFAFETGTAGNTRPNAAAKCQAAEQFAQHNITEDALHAALRHETNDAEELIYQENQDILNSGAPYVTVVAATMLTGNDPGKIAVGRDTLQGVYTAQHEYNAPNAEHSLPNNVKVRVLIANAGSNSADVTRVAQQVIQLANTDHTFIGVIGWNFSSYAKLEIQLLNKAKIPMILPTATEDTLTQNSPYAFRIAPTNKKEATVGANYINTYLQAKRVLLFVDNNDNFSGNLARDFVGAYGRQNIVSIQPYKVGNTSTLLDKLAPLLIQYNPDLIYFAGYPNDLITLLNQFPSTGPYSSLKIMGGDSLYEVNAHYPHNTYKHLLFTATAFPDVWANEGLPIPAFFEEYRQNFDPTNSHPGAYSWSRADADAILSYDALLALLNGCTNAMSGQAPSSMPSLQDVEQGLNNVSIFQGASGLISFQDDYGNTPTVVNKVVVMLTVDQNEKTQIQQIYGCLTQSHCY